ncbi:hypothetical protein DJ021_06440 [Phenylobacterium hankyongense]|uniref:Uncharacterized protein n=1 Tax=Phenylobacterium hankyongense TaxID=1813876 RepID=A0A328B385_9CAUL|nr:hypothetical protein DJ021_06440 [Phenylobacterium hankyongense]
MVRSAFEGSLKSAYLLQSPATFEERHQQYRHDLFQIALLKGHTKVADLIGIMPENDHKSWRPYRDRLLSEEERAEISSRYPKAMRRALETKWGFTGLIGELSRSEDPLFSGFTGLADGYAMASHILHADIVGTAVPLDRDRRDEARRDAILLAHGVRLISDVHTCLQLRLGVGYRYIGQDPAPLIDAHQRIAALTESFGKVYEDWMGVEYPDG